MQHTGAEHHADGLTGSTHIRGGPANLAAGALLVSAFLFKDPSLLAPTGGRRPFISLPGEGLLQGSWRCTVCQP